MAFGLAKGTTDNYGEHKRACYSQGEELINRFTELHGDLT